MSPTTQEQALQNRRLIEQALQDRRLIALHEQGKKNAANTRLAEIRCRLKARFHQENYGIRTVTMLDTDGPRRIAGAACNGPLAWATPKLDVAAWKRFAYGDIEEAPAKTPKPSAEQRAKQWLVEKSATPTACELARRGFRCASPERVLREMNAAGAPSGLTRKAVEISAASTWEGFDHPVLKSLNPTSAR